MNVEKVYGNTCLEEFVKSGNKAGSIRRTQVPPGLFYNGGVVDVLECRECLTVSLYEKSYESQSCWCCGNKEGSVRKAKWISKSTWWNLLTWSDGYWDFQIK